MTQTKKLKFMIIENFIDHWTSNEEERKLMKNTAFLYVENDHVDEIEQGIIERIKNQLKGIDEADMTKAEKRIKEIIK
jgi:hypothetical protein